MGASALYLPERRQGVSKTTTSARTSRTPRPSSGSGAKSARASANDRMDWQEFDALTDEEVIARAMTDPDNKPLTKDEARRMKRRPRAYIVRRALRMTQEEFAEAYGIPIGTLRDWEQGRTEPDQANRAYLKVIAGDPAVGKRALTQRPA